MFPLCEAVCPPPKDPPHPSPEFTTALSMGSISVQRCVFITRGSTAVQNIHFIEVVRALRICIYYVDPSPEFLFSFGPRDSTPYRDTEFLCPLGDVITMKVDTESFTLYPLYSWVLLLSKGTHHPRIHFPGNGFPAQFV